MDVFILCYVCASMGASAQHVCEHRRTASKSQVLYIYQVGSGDPLRSSGWGASASTG